MQELHSRIIERKVEIIFSNKPVRDWALRDWITLLLVVCIALLVLSAASQSPLF